MSRKLQTPPSVEHVQGEGSALQTTGAIVAIIGLLIGGVAIFNGGSAVVVGLLPIGLLIMLSGYMKQIAAATTASYTLAKNKHDAEHISSAE